jgi:hypothetical protein
MKPINWRRLTGAGWHASSLALLLGLLGQSTISKAQATPAANRWHVEPGTSVYLDGQPSTITVIDQIKDEDVASVEGALFHKTTSRTGQAEFKDKYIVLTTKANATSPATLELANKLHLGSAHVTQPAPISAIAPAALAYITSHYPKAWLGGEVTKMTRKSTGAVKYRVQLADNWGWRYVSFTAAGEFVDNGF